MGHDYAEPPSSLEAKDNVSAKAPLSSPSSTVELEEPLPMMQNTSTQMSSLSHARLPHVPKLNDISINFAACEAEEVDIKAIGTDFAASKAEVVDIHFATCKSEDIGIVESAPIILSDSDATLGEPYKNTSHRSGNNVPGKIIIKHQETYKKSLAYKEKDRIMTEIFKQFEVLGGRLLIRMIWGQYKLATDEYKTKIKIRRLGRMKQRLKKNPNVARTGTRKKKKISISDIQM